MPRLVIFRAALFALVSTATLHGQGALTPPGAPAPTMKSLAQVEPRRPVDAINTPGNAQYAFIISAPGSYYLTADVVGSSGRSGILVDVNDARGVTIDLNGFAVVGTGQDAGDGASGIVSGAELTPVTVYGGRVVGWSMQGVFIAGPARVQDLLVADCGWSGIEVYGGTYSETDDSRVSVIERCEVRNVRRYAINAFAARVDDCMVSRVRNAGTSEAVGIAAIQVGDSRVLNVSNSSTAPAIGISASSASDCVVENVVGGGSVTHLSARLATGCRVGRTIAPLASTGSDRGIDGQIVERCHVLGLLASTSGMVHGIRAVQVRNSVVERVSNSGNGAVYGIAASSVALAGTGSSTTPVLQAEGNTVSGISGIGIAGGGSTARIVGNLVRGCTGAAITQVASGVVANNTLNLPTGSAGNGIDVSDSQVHDNYVRNRGTGVGVRVLFAGVAVRNTVQGGTAFDFAAGVRAGTIVGGGGTGTFDPDANVDL